MKPSPQIRSAAACLVLPLLTGCSLIGWPWWHTHAHPEPAARATLSGSIAVAPARGFVYEASIRERISPNRIPNTAAGSLILKRNIDDSVREAVVRELAAAGLRVRGTARCELSGHIERLFVDDLRAPTHWNLRLRYVLTDKARGAVVYTATRTVRLERNTFTNTSLALEDLVRENVRTLLADPAFALALERTD